MLSRPIIVGIGEILWDMFPDGPQFGGAPANFACSVGELSGGCVDVHIVSAVGDDELGRHAVERLRTHRVDTTFVSVVDRPTGQVLVHLDSSGQASYEFASNTAWDNLTWSDRLRQLAARADAVCFGTLGQRSDVSRKTIQRFVHATRPDCLRILDINLRQPYWTKEVVLESLELANSLKLNDAELSILADELGWTGDNEGLIGRLFDRFSLQLIALTRGDDGALVRSASGELCECKGEKVTVLNTVGAGDSYTAALVIGKLNGLSLPRVTTWANRVAAFVCTQPGATPKLPASLRTD